MANTRKYTNTCKICFTPITDKYEYCNIHRDKKVQEIHKGFKKDNIGKSYEEYLKDIK